MITCIFTSYQHLRKLSMCDCVFCSILLMMIKYYVGVMITYEICYLFLLNSISFHYFTILIDGATSFDQFIGVNLWLSSFEVYLDQYRVKRHQQFQLDAPRCLIRVLWGSKLLPRKIFLQHCGVALNNLFYKRVVLLLTRNLIQFLSILTLFRSIFYSTSCCFHSWTSPYHPTCEWEAKVLFSGYWVF